MREAVHERIVRTDAEHGLFLLFDNRVYQPVAACTHFGGRHPMPLGSKFKPGQKVRFTVEAGWRPMDGRYLKIKGLSIRIDKYGQRRDPFRRPLFSIHAATAGIKAHNYQEVWEPVKVKPEGHYHYAC